MEHETGLGQCWEEPYGQVLAMARPCGTVRRAVWGSETRPPRAASRRVRVGSRSGFLSVCYIARPPTHDSSSRHHLYSLKGDPSSVPICWSSCRVLVPGHPRVAPPCRPLLLVLWCIHPSSTSTHHRKSHLGPLGHPDFLVVLFQGYSAKYSSTHPHRFIQVLLGFGSNRHPRNLHLGLQASFPASEGGSFLH